MPRVHFTRPVVTEVKAPAPKGRPNFLSYTEISAVCRELRNDGYDERAIVAKRIVFPNGAPNLFLMTGARNWGIVIDLKTSVSMVNSEPYKPIKVQWVRDGSISEHWPEDLVLLHSAVSQYGMEMVVKGQLEDA